MPLGGSFLGPSPSEGMRGGPLHQTDPMPEDTTIEVAARLVAKAQQLYEAALDSGNAEDAKDAAVGYRAAAESLARLRGEVSSDFTAIIDGFNQQVAALDGAERGPAGQG